MRILSILSQKGGTGKTTLAGHLAVQAQRTGAGPVAVLDADLQNDPGDLPGMLALQARTGADVVQGDRSGARRDNLVRRLSSRGGRLIRRTLLGDDIRDSGCSLRVLRREVALALPLEFRGMHRFIPATAREFGFHIVETPVNHRPRVAGEAKYGVWNRALPAFIDALALRWMRLYAGSRQGTSTAMDSSTCSSCGERWARPPCS